MSSVEKQSGYVAFQPRARLLKLIGAELISDDVVAVTELVKNAYDADANEVVIRFESVGEAGGRIIVSDDGHGMDRDALLGGWMEPAGSTKRGEERKVSPRGRWMLGEKGLGRFSADKLGRHLELISRRTGSAAEVRATFDWDQFDTDTAMLGEVKNRWEIRPAEILKKPGTILIISGLRAAWTERMFRRLSTRLARLRSPFQSRDPFSIRIESDDFPEYSRELSSGYLDASPYRVDVRFDGQDTLEVHLNDERLTLVPWTGPALTCGPMRVRLNAFDLETEAIARVGPRMEVRAWLREWSGISIYRDGFRVWPYGEPHDDWLRLDARRVNNPVVCLSNNQIVGFVELSQKENPELRDQTNREGLIHNQAYEDLRRFMHFVLQLLEAERQAIRHPEGREHRSKRRSEAAVSSADPELERLQELAKQVGGKAGAELRGISNRLAEQRQRRDGEHRRLVETYADLAARGQAIRGLGPEAEKAMKELRGLAAHMSGLMGGMFRNTPLVGQLQDSVRQLEARMGLIASLSEGHGRRRRSIEVPVELRHSERLFRPLFGAHRVKFHLDLSHAQGLLRTEMTPESLRLILHLLLENAFDWLATVKAPSINLALSGDEESVELLLSDNGPGISAGLEERIFEPAFTLKEGGHGMGLTIARNIVEAHGGTLTAVVDRRRKGATFQLLLPRRRSKATR